MLLKYKVKPFHPHFFVCVLITQPFSIPQESKKQQNAPPAPGGIVHHQSFLGISSSQLRISLGLQPECFLWSWSSSAKSENQEHEQTCPDKIKNTIISFWRRKKKLNQLTKIRAIQNFSECWRIAFEISNVFIYFQIVICKTYLVSLSSKSCKTVSAFISISSQLGYQVSKCPRNTSDLFYFFAPTVNHSSYCVGANRDKGVLYFVGYLFLLPS